MEWPHINIETGEYETIRTEKLIWKRSLDGAICDITQNPIIRNKIAKRIYKLKERIDESTNDEWKTNDYRYVVEEFTSIMANATSEQALDMAQCGLDALHDTMLFRVDHHTIVPSKDIFVLSSSFTKLQTEYIYGSKLSTKEKNKLLYKQQQQQQQQKDKEEKEQTEQKENEEEEEEEKVGKDDDDDNNKQEKKDDVTEQEEQQLEEQEQEEEEEEDNNDYYGDSYDTDEYQFGLISPIDITETLTKYDACDQIDAWFKYGIMETSSSVMAKSTLVSNTISNTITNNKIFVLLGVTSELGPIKSLLKIPNTTVLGISRPNSKRLNSLRSYVRCNCPKSSQLLIPTIEDPNNTGTIISGADIITQGPQIASWVLDTITKIEYKRSNGKPETLSPLELLLFPLAYENGESNLRICVAMDLIIQRIFRQRLATLNSIYKHTNNTTKIILCQYVSPATCMVVPPTSSTNALQRYENRPKWETLLSTISLNKWLQPSIPEYETSIDNNNDYSIVNGIMTIQGSIYCLSKTMQIWRCMISYYRDNYVVAAPYCPLTRTKSMLESSISTPNTDNIINYNDPIPTTTTDSTTTTTTGTHMTTITSNDYDNINTPISAVLEGMQHFEPMLSFDINVASTLMCSIILSQIQLLNRPLPDMDVSPFTILWDGGAVHSGIWNCPYSLESISTVSWLLGKTYYPKGYIPIQSLPPSKRNNNTQFNGSNENGEDDNKNGEEQNNNNNNDLEEGKDNNNEDDEEENDMFAMGSEYGKPMPDCVRERLEFM